MISYRQSFLYSFFSRINSIIPNSSKHRLRYSIWRRYICKCKDSNVSVFCLRFSNGYIIGVCSFLVESENQFFLYTDWSGFLKFEILWLLKQKYMIFICKQFLTLPNLLVYVYTFYWMKLNDDDKLKSTINFEFYLR